MNYDLENLPIEISKHNLKLFPQAVSTMRAKLADRILTINVELFVRLADHRVSE
jgi:hypothetical protein